MLSRSSGMPTPPSSGGDVTAYSARGLGAGVGSGSVLSPPLTACAAVSTCPATSSLREFRRGSTINTISAAITTITITSVSHSTRA